VSSFSVCISKRRIFCVFLAGIAGIVCFTLTIRLAYASLMKKLQARDKLPRKKTVRIDLTPETVPLSPVQKTIGVLNAFNFPDETKVRDRSLTIDSLADEVDESVRSRLNKK